MTKVVITHPASVGSTQDKAPQAVGDGLFLLLSDRFDCAIYGGEINITYSANGQTNLPIRLPTGDGKALFLYSFELLRSFHLYKDPKTDSTTTRSARGAALPLPRFIPP